MTDAGGVLLVIGFILSLNCMYIQYRSNKTDQSFANRGFYQPSIAVTLASRSLHQVFDFDACFIISNYSEDFTLFYLQMHISITNIAV